MQVSSVGVQSNSFSNKKRVQKQNVAFKGIVADVAKDSHSELVQKSVNQFFEFMKKTVTKAGQGDAKAQEKLNGLIGKEAGEALAKDEKAFTAKADETTKLIPLSGLGTRGKGIRDAVTGALGMKPTHKAVMPLPAKLGDHEGKPVFLTTVNNEFLHMMQAKIMSPFEKLDFVKGDISEGDLSVVTKGIKEGVVPTKKPAVLTYTDDIGSHGHKDYENVVAAFKAEPKGSKAEVISVGFEAEKHEAAGKLGTFFPNQDGSFRVVEKPSMEALEEAIPGEQKVLTNIGKTLFTPKGLEDIKQRDIVNPNSLKKEDKGEMKYHVAIGVLGPAGKKGALKVIPKGGQFSDVGNGPVFTDKMVEVAEGKLEHIFPAPLEAQIAKNVQKAPDGKSATLNYDGTKVVLPTSEA